MPHGHCYLWSPSLLWLHVICDALIVLSYFSIPLGLLYFLRKRSDLNFGSVIGCFALFIVACGTTHLLEIWNVWHSAYWLSGGVKAVTALASVSTAWWLIRLIPAAIALPSPARLREANAALKEEIATRENAEERIRQLNADLERREAEKNAGHFAAIVQSSFDAIIGKDLHGIVTSWNPGAERMFGFSAEEMVGHSITQIIPPDRQDEENDILAFIRRGDRVEHFETLRKRRDGSLIDVAITVSPIKNTIGEIVGVSKVARDITQPKKAADELRKSEERFSKAFHASPVIIAITTFPDGRYVDVNEHFVSALGYAREEVLGRRALELGVWEKPEQRAEVLRQIETKGFVREFECNLRTKAGEVRTALVGVEKIVLGDQPCLLFINHDITERKRAEARAEWLASFPEKNPIPILEIDIAGGRFHYLNPSALKLFPELPSLGLAHPLLAGLPEVAEQLGEMGTIVREVAERDLFYSQVISYAAESQRVRVYNIDITERKRAAQVVLNERDFSEAVIASLPGVLYLYDETGKFLRWNKNFEQVTGYSGGEIATMHPLDFFAGAEKELLAARIGEVFSKGVSDVEANFVSKGGRQTPYYFTGVTTVLNGKTCLIGVGIDISERRKAEQAHLASEQRMRLATEATAVGVWEWNIITNKVVWDAQMFRIYGLPPTDDGLVDYNVWAQAVHPEDLPRQEELMRETLAKLCLGSREFRIRRGDESGYRYIAAVETVRTNAKGNAEWVVGTNLDITERKNAEKALRESEELFAKSFRLSPDCVSIVRASDRTVIRANDALCQLWGSTPEEVIGKRTLEYTTWLSEEERLIFMRTLAEHGESLNYETKLAINDGRLLDFNISSRVITYNRESCFLTVMRDITERKRTERAVMASELRFRRLFETSNDGILILAAATGEVLDVNPFLTGILGFGRQEFLGKAIWELAFFRDVVASEASFAELRDQEHFQCQNMLLDTFAGQQIDVDFISNAYLVDDTEVIQFNVRDVTARREAEHVIHQLNLDLEQRVIERTAQLEAANKELEAFSYSVSHDLRAPLRTMDGFSQAVLEDFGPQLPEECQRYLETIRKGAQRMGQLIDDLLTFARLSRAPLNRRAVNLTKLVEEIWNDLAPERGARRVEMHASPLPECSGDPALLAQVWVNLLSNALKYSRTRDPAVIEIGSTRESGETVYFVRDNGTGFDMRYAHKLFGVFQRLHRAEEYEGTGVGLAIVQRVIHRHGGRIWTESELDRGATFYFTLPSNN